MNFSYRAQDSLGKEIVDQATAKDRFELSAILKKKGLTVYVITPITKNAWLEHLKLAVSRVSLKHKIYFAQNLGAMIGAGLSLSRALGIVARQTSSVRLRQVVQEVGDKINNGSGLSEAMKAHLDVFPPALVSMVSAGEESGNLPDTLILAAEQMKKSYDLRRKVRGAMVYPAVVLSAIVIVGYVMMIYLVPTLSATFKELNVELPLSTKILIGLGDFLAASPLLIFGLILIATVGVIYFFRTKFGRRVGSLCLIRMPLFGKLIVESNSAVVARTLSSLIKAGVSMIESVRITSEVTQNHYYLYALVASSFRIEKGENLSALFREQERLFPPFVSEMIEVGEETGRLSEMLLKVAIFYEEDVEQITKNISTLIEPLLMIIIGAAVGFFAISVIGPMYSLGNVI